MKRAIILSAAMLALCGPAYAQYSDPDIERRYLQDEQFIQQMDQDRQMFETKMDFERQLQQQRDEAQFQQQQQQWQMEDRQREQDLLNNFGCDIHNHCR
jgi:hypothetical protein